MTAVRKPNIWLPPKPSFYPDLKLVDASSLEESVAWHIRNGKHLPVWIMAALEERMSINPPFPGSTQNNFVFGPTQPNADKQVFSVPEWVKGVYAVIIGPGGNGGNGFTGVAGTARGGGGGGGSGSITRVFIPKFLLGSTLYIYVGTPGNACGLSLEQSTAAQDGIASASTGGAGGNGTAAAGGGAGTAGAVMGATAFPMLGLCTWNSIAGGAGAAGGAHTGANGGSSSFSTTGTPLSGGAGGGGVTAVDFPGGSVTGGGRILTIGGGAAGNNPGRGGIEFNNPWAAMGGSGGGSSNASTGGIGGVGATGCGGGGGGGGVAGGGTGGRGGNGRVILTLI
jgi:hypothetical protein